MFKAFLVFTAGLLVGAVAVWATSDVPSQDAPQQMVPAVPISCDAEVGTLRERVSELELQMRDSLRTPLPEPRQVEEEVTGSTGGELLAGNPQEEARIREATTWRISAIEKFVPLTQQQKDRLSEKFLKEAGSDSTDESSESLEDILGAESAAYYREQVKSAFQRVQDQETEKEVVWLSRQLSLTAQQEQSIRDIYQRVEQQVDQEIGAGAHDQTSKSPQDRVKRMIQENRRRDELRNSMVKEVLTAEQYQNYIRSQAESSSSDIEVFHDSGD